MIKDATGIRNVGIFPTSKYTKPINSIAFADESPFALIDFYTIWNPFNKTSSRLMHASETILRVCVQVFNTTVIKGEANTSVTQWYTNFTNVATDPRLPGSGLWATLPDGQKFRFGAAPYGTLGTSCGNSSTVPLKRASQVVVAITQQLACKVLSPASTTHHTIVLLFISWPRT